jgi:FtsP/CotA-like multicopper oxidase with cupredoxin domain
MQPLPLPSLVDLSKCDAPTIEIRTTLHKFAPDADPSGTDTKMNPVFGTQLSTFGLPFFRMRQGTKPRIRFINTTDVTFDLHWHGLNTTADVDGASTQVEFGPNTKIGRELNINFPKIRNNSTLLWVHAHPMFRSSTLTYTGVYGLLDIVDCVSWPVTKRFHYPDNHLMCVYQDVDLTATGTEIATNLYTDEQRSGFGVINGVSCVNWSSDAKVPFVTQLKHTASRNLVKLDLLNGTSSFRTLYLGVSNSKGQIQPFTLIQTDTGLRKPLPLTVLAIGPANRRSIVLNLKNFPGGVANIFFYDFDLTENGGATAAPEGLVAPIPIGPNPTPTPTPIPGPDTQLIYPLVPAIPQQTQILVNGEAQLSPLHQGKVWLRVKWTGAKKQSYTQLIHAVKKVVFGESSHWRCPNYIRHLNPNYYYNLPDFKHAATRNYILFPDTNQNSNVPGGNPNGSTEFIDGANRVMVDLWNSDELDLKTALVKYNENPNNYKPDVLPTLLFKIYPASPFVNYAMLQNDRLTIQFFTQPISYGDTKTLPLAEVDIVFPPVQLLNINQWTQLVQANFASTSIIVASQRLSLGEVLAYDWTFYPFQLTPLTSTQPVILKSVFAKTTNKTQYILRLKATWPLLQFFGKPLSADMGASMTGLQQIFPEYATNDPNNPIIMGMDNQAELIITPRSTYLGPIDGFQSDNLLNLAVKKNSTERWVYHNLDNQDAHPFHFHLTSGYVDPEDPDITPGLLTRPYDSYLYSMDTYSIGPQQTLAFYLKFIHFTSEEGALEPPVQGLGYMYHCHYMSHHDMNMMGSYFVYSKRNKYFS